MGEISENDPGLRKIQVFHCSPRKEVTLVDRQTKFSDWKRAVKAIARIKPYAKQIKGLKAKLNEALRKDKKQSCS